VTHQTLYDAFQPFGLISEAKVMIDWESHKSRGYGFVSFCEKADAERAMSEMNGKTIGRREVRINWAVRKQSIGAASEDEKSSTTSSNPTRSSITNSNTSLEQIIQTAPACCKNTLYVGNLPSSCNEQLIREKFQLFGAIQEVRIFSTYGFISFEQKEHAANAILEMNGKALDGGGLPIRVSWSRGEGN